jgi:dihydrodipicolinate synthase/N-acetylneuraminate lyase
VVTATEAKDWAREHLRGNCGSLYTPFSGRDGDEIDYAALRALVRYCLVDLNQDGLWLTGGVGEFWSLTTDELKEVVRVAIAEARAVKPDALIQVLSSSDNAKQCVELYREVPAVCGLKNGLFDPEHSLAIHKLAPEMVLWETSDEAGIKLGIPHPGSLGSVLYLYEAPGRPLFREHRELLLQGDYEQADKFAEESGLRAMRATIRNYNYHPARPDTFTHWGAGFKFGASLLGLPVGDYPHSRPPQTAFPDELKGPIRAAYRDAGFLRAGS